MKNGYSFRYVIVGASGLGAPAKYELAATPLSYGRTGHRSFFRDAGGTLRAADRQGAVGSRVWIQDCQSTDSYWPFALSTTV